LTVVAIRATVFVSSFLPNKVEVFMQLEKAERKIQPLTIEQAQSVLARAARNVGRIYSVGLSVGRKSNGLMFVDDLGEDVVDDFAPDGPLAIPCASEDEVNDGSFLKLFAARSLYAALTLKIGEIIESEATP
jgi:hypothetical protein